MIMSRLAYLTFSMMMLVGEITGPDMKQLEFVRVGTNLGRVGLSQSVLDQGLSSQ